MSAAAFAPFEGESSPRVEAAAFVLTLRARGIADLRLLRAMETVRREVFAPRRYSDLARQDIALPLACGQTMTGPSTVARMLAALGVVPGQRVFEVGTGSGYVTGLLAALGGQVSSVERRPVLLDSARHRLRAAGFAEGCTLACGDGITGEGAEGRFDRILLNGVVEEGALPALASLLAPGGRLVAGIAGEDGARLLVVESGEGGDLTARRGEAIRLSRLS